MSFKGRRGSISRRDFLAGMIAAGAVNFIPWRTTRWALAAPADENTDELEWPAHVEDFPALAYDKADHIFLATLERPVPERFIRVYRVDGLERQQVCTLEPEGLTGIAPPAIAGLDDGCLVVFPVEQGDHWHLAYSFIDDGTSGSQTCNYIGDSLGTSNICPAIAAVGSRACIVWESNAGPARGIHACWVDQNGAGEIQRLSAPDVNSYNPAVVACEDGSLFAAWDSVRNKSADIFGAWHRDGEWQAEQRITSNARIERHPALAAQGNNVWIAWQAQTFPGRQVNNITEQRVAVACISGDTLLAPAGLFEQVSADDRMLVRPQIAFDAEGNLWLTARECLGTHGGWQPVVWCYDGNEWMEQMLLDQQGRRWPVHMAHTVDEAVGASQCDDLPQGFVDKGIHPDWHSAVTLCALPDKEAASTWTVEPLVMPSTDFFLKHKFKYNAAELPRQRRVHQGQELTLYWGDLHEHTDLSVCNRQANPPGHDLFANMRDIERLDFCTLTDHGFNFDRPQWAFNGEQVRSNHDPGKFLTFLGEEWTSSGNPPANPGDPTRYGHRNLIFLDPYHSQFYDSCDGDISPADLWEQLGDTEFICIPHQIADWRWEGRFNPPTDWSFVDEVLQPVAEVWQARESYEYLGCPRQAPDGAPFEGYYLQDAWAKGVVIGVIASPDHGGGKGKVGVWVNELTRESIFGAIRARHTFGTSGAKMALWFGTDTTMMGDKLARADGNICFQVSALALQKINELVIFRNNEVVHRVEPSSESFDLYWTDENPPQEEMLWYYARIHAEDNELAWSSPIWFLNTGTDQHVNKLYFPLICQK